MVATLCSEKKTSIHIFFVENVQIYTKFSGYVYEELGNPSKSKLNIHRIQIFIFYRGFLKRIIQKRKYDVRITSPIAMNI